MSMTRSLAAVVAVLLACLAYVVVVALTERVSYAPTTPTGKTRRAALAIRDNVTPFQKWGSKQFTWPYLDNYYQAAWYFTQSDSDNCKQAFQSCLETALGRYAEVDLYLLAHGNFFVQWVAELPAERRGHLRLVYNTGCHDLPQGPWWLSLGAKAYVGHPGVSASPIFYFYFLRRWTRGATLQDAVEESNGRLRSALARVQLMSLGQVDAARTSQESEAFCYGEKGLRFTGAPE
jgi:hypothetical protein